MERVIVIKSKSRSNRLSSSLLLADERNDIHEIYKLGKKDDISSHCFDSVWMFLASSLIEIGDSDFPLVSLTEKLVFYIKIISGGKRA